MKRWLVISSQTPKFVLKPREWNERNNRALGKQSYPLTVRVRNCHFNEQSSQHNVDQRFTSLNSHAPCHSPYPFVTHWVNPGFAHQGRQDNAWAQAEPFPAPPHYASHTSLTSSTAKSRLPAVPGRDLVWLCGKFYKFKAWLTVIVEDKVRLNLCKAKKCGSRMNSKLVYFKIISFPVHLFTR